MKKKTIIIAAAIACLIIVGIILIIATETPANSNDGKLVLNETMILVIEDGFEYEGRYDPRLCPNGQLALSRANRTILELEEKNGKEIDFEFVDYELHSYSKVDDYNFVAKMTLKGRNGKGEYTYMETEAYFFCIEADTVGGFDLQAYCTNIESELKKML